MVCAPECNGAVLTAWEQDLLQLCESHMMGYTDAEFQKAFEHLRLIARSQDWANRTRNVHVLHHLLLSAVKHRMYRDLRAHIDASYQENEHALKTYIRRLTEHKNRLAAIEVCGPVHTAFESTDEAYTHDTEWVRQLIHFCDRVLVRASRFRLLEILNSVVCEATTEGWVARARSTAELQEMATSAVQVHKYKDVLQELTLRYQRCQSRLNDATDNLGQALEELT